MALQITMGCLTFDIYTKNGRYVNCVLNTEFALTGSNGKC